MTKITQSKRTASFINRWLICLLFLTGIWTTQVEMGSQKAGDCDGNNVVALGDFNMLKSAFGSTYGDPAYDARTDYDGNFDISLIDFSLLRANYGFSGASLVAP